MHRKSHKLTPPWMIFTLGPLGGTAMFSTAMAFHGSIFWLPLDILAICSLLVMLVIFG